MLYLFVGATSEMREKLHAMMQKVSTETPMRITGEEMADTDMEMLAHTQGLFAPALCVFLDAAFVSKEMRDRVLDAREALAQSPNHFFILEPSLDAASLKSFQKHATVAEVEKKALAKAERSGGFFSVADALGARDRKVFWAEVVRARELGAAPEELHGILWWGVKNMLLARDAKNATEAGLSPFVFGKAKRFAGNFKPGELEALAEKLSTLLYRTRARNADSGLALEHFALTIQ